MAPKKKKIRNKPMTKVIASDQPKRNDHMSIELNNGPTKQAPIMKPTMKKASGRKR